jgi:hypothetical protein
MNGNLRKLPPQTEEATSFGLASICKKLNAAVLLKVKVQDVFRIDGAGLPDELVQYATRSVFDYVAVDSERTPIFVVQFDGTSHTTDVQSLKQQQENEICRKFVLPLVRVQAYHLSKKHLSLEIVGNLLEQWFSQKGDPKSRTFRAGEDVFSPSGPASSMPTSTAPVSTAFADIEGAGGGAGDVRKHIRRLYESGKCRSPVPSSVIGVDVAGNYHAVGFIRVTDESVASAKVALRNHLFPTTTTVLTEEILVYELYQELLDVIRGRGRLVTRAELGATIAAFRMRYKVRTGGPASTPPGSMPPGTAGSI